MRPLLFGLLVFLVGCGGNTQPTGESTPPPQTKTDVKQTKDGKQNTVTSVGE